MAGLKFKFSYKSGQTGEVMSFQFARFPKACFLAVEETGRKAVLAGRAAIASGGGRLGKGFQNGLRVRVYPGNIQSVKDHAAAFIWHNAFYANVFETGAVIKGDPIMWIPLPAAPRKLGRGRPTPDEFRARGYELILLQRPGKNPVLLATTAANKRGKGSKATIKNLDAGKAGGGATVPVFVGIRVSRLKKKYSVKAAVAQANTGLGAAFRKYLFEGNNG